MAQFSSNVSNIFFWVVVNCLGFFTSQRPSSAKVLASVFLPCTVKPQVKGQRGVHLSDGFHDECTLVTSWRIGCHVHVLGLQPGTMPSSGSALENLPQQATYSPGLPADRSLSPAPQPVCVGSQFTDRSAGLPVAWQKGEQQCISSGCQHKPGIEVTRGAQGSSTQFLLGFC